MASNLPIRTAVGQWGNELIHKDGHSRRDICNNRITHKDGCVALGSGITHTDGHNTNQIVRLPIRTVTIYYKGTMTTNYLGIPPTKVCKNDADLCLQIRDPQSGSISQWSRELQDIYYAPGVHVQLIH